jgi:hypothetical protein
VLLVTTALTLICGGLAPVASAATGAIQPGVAIIAGTNDCTLNWIYERLVADPNDPQGENLVVEGVYGGTAAHCVDALGQEVSLQTQTAGEIVMRIGQVAYMAPGTEPTSDYAFIRIDDENLDLVDPSLKGHPQIPTGVSTTSTAKTGDTIQFSGNGVGFHAHELTRERRQGVLNSNDGVQHDVLGPVTGGDSGGPVADVTDGNKALGIVNWLNARAGGPNGGNVGEGGLSLEGLLADALEHGWNMRLKTI